jgi:AAA+ ATPase superfamily predicted ATPase
MIEAFGNSSATYFSILEGIAMGKNTNNEVAAYVGLKETSLPIDYSKQHNPYP